MLWIINTIVALCFCFSGWLCGTNWRSWGTCWRFCGSFHGRTPESSTGDHGGRWEGSHLRCHSWGMDLWLSFHETLYICHCARPSSPTVVESWVPETKSCGSKKNRFYLFIYLFRLKAISSCWRVHLCCSRSLVCTSQQLHCHSMHSEPWQWHERYDSHTPSSLVLQLQYLMDIHRLS